MKLAEIINEHGYKTNTVRICEFLGFEDTDQLKNAKFFSQEESYSPIPIPGICMSNGDMTWRLCKVSDPEQKLYTVDYGYKIRLEICDGSGYGNHIYYQSDFLSLLENGFIIYCNDETDHIEHIKWTEKLCGEAWLFHEADVVMKGDKSHE